jgi:hypothetical protein
MGVCLLLGMAFGLPLSAALIVHWLREPTWEESARALGTQHNDLIAREMELRYLFAEGRVPEEEVKRARLEVEKKEKELKELNRQWDARYNSRLERLRQDIRRRLGW